MEELPGFLNRVARVRARFRVCLDSDSEDENEMKNETSMWFGELEEA